ncbi:MAG: hypothetical protein RL040_397, partial [Bacteroidota bacterium]
MPATHPSDSNNNFVSREEYDRALAENKLLRAVFDQLPSEIVVVTPEL